MLASIQKLAFPNAAALSAQLYKLNVHQPGDFFKAHLDTPRSGSMVGTLVVCLPRAHTGGQLVVQHQDSTAKYDWGSQLDGSTRILHWAFFFSDVRHEILPITSGTRLTLTYNLLATPAEAPPLQAVHLAAAPFGKALCALLANAKLLPGGGSLGFSCKHLYPHTSAGFGSMLLKGIDAVVMATAKQLHLDAQLEPVWKPTMDECLKEQFWGEMEEDWVCSCETCSKAAGNVPWKYAVGGKLQLSTSHDCLGDSCSFGQEAGEQLPKSYNARSVRRIMWVQKDFEFQLGLVGLGWGNEPCLDAMYSAAAIIIKVPPSEARTQHVTVSNDE